MKRFLFAVGAFFLPFAMGAFLIGVGWLWYLMASAVGTWLGVPWQVAVVIGIPVTVLFFIGAALAVAVWNDEL